MMESADLPGAVARWNDSRLEDPARTSGPVVGTLAVATEGLLFLARRPGEPVEAEVPPEVIARWPLPRGTLPDDPRILTVDEGPLEMTTLRVGHPDRPATIFVHRRIKTEILEALARIGVPEELLPLSRGVLALRGFSRAAPFLIVAGLIPAPGLRLHQDPQSLTLVLLGLCALVATPRPWLLLLEVVGLLAAGGVEYARSGLSFWVAWDLFFAYHFFQIHSEVSPLAIDSGNWEWMERCVRTPATLPEELLPGWFTRLTALVLGTLSFLYGALMLLSLMVMAVERGVAALFGLLTLTGAWFLLVAAAPRRAARLFPSAVGGFFTSVLTPLWFAFLFAIVISVYCPLPQPPPAAARSGAASPSPLPPLPDGPPVKAPGASTPRQPAPRRPAGRGRTGRSPRASSTRTGPAPGERAPTRRGTARARPWRRTFPSGHGSGSGPA